MYVCHRQNCKCVSKPTVIWVWVVLQGWYQWDWGLGISCFSSLFWPTMVTTIFQEGWVRKTEMFYYKEGSCNLRSKLSKKSLLIVVARVVEGGVRIKPHNITEEVSHSPNQKTGQTANFKFSGKAFIFSCLWGLAREPS